MAIARRLRRLNCNLRDLVFREARCMHISHRFGTPLCVRYYVYDGYCWKHNRSCFNSCEDDD